MCNAYKEELLELLMEAGNYAGEVAGIVAFDFAVWNP